MLWRLSLVLWLLCMVVSMTGGWAAWPYLLIGIGFQAITLWEVASIEYYKKKLPRKDTTKWKESI